MKVLVTGGSGFLGTSVGAGLAAAGHEVVSADLRPPTATGVVAATLDVTDAAGVRAVLEEHRPEAVVHLAAIVTPGRDSDRELERRVDVDGTRHVLDACVATGVRRLVVSSSGAAYGYHPDSPEWLHESDPVRGNDEFPYAKHKRLVEQLLAGYRLTHPELEQVAARHARLIDRKAIDLVERLQLVVNCLAPRAHAEP